MQPSSVSLDATAFFDAMDMLVHVLDRGGRYRYVNPASVALMRRPSESMVGKHYLEVMPDLRAGEHDLAFQRVASGASTLEKLDFFHAPSGTWSSQSIYAIGDYLVVTSVDITGRKRAEARQAETSARATQSEQQFRAMIEGMPQLAWYARPDGYIDYYNPRWYEYTGTTPEEMAGWGWRAVHHPDVVDEVVRRWKSSVETGAPFEMEFPLRATDGTFRWFMTRAQPLRDADGKIFRWVGINADIHDQRMVVQNLEAARQELERAREEAETANRAKDDFLALLGHELRNPLAPILTALQLMRLKGDTAHERERKVIERQVKHLVRLLEDLLDVSRIARGKVELSRERLELSEVAARAIEIASPILDVSRHNFTSSVPKQGLLIDGDPARLAQVISNLLNNAAKYTPAGGQVTLSAAREGDEVVVQVRDSGVGIPRELLPRVFEMFVQNHQTIERAQGGLGLGLAIVRNLVALHGGSVSAQSEGAGQGSTFSVRLPVAKDAAPVQRATREATPARGTALPRQRILIVDDNQDAANLLSETLQLLGYPTRVAHDGPAALGALASFVPQVALLDIGLPIMDGYELARRLRQQPGLETLHLIAMTGYGLETDRKLAEEAGFGEHVVKPVHIDELAALLEAEGANR